MHRAIRDSKATCAQPPTSNEQPPQPDASPVFEAFTRAHETCRPTRAARPRVRSHQSAPIPSPFTREIQPGELSLGATTSTPSPATTAPWLGLAPTPQLRRAYYTDSRPSPPTARKCRPVVPSMPAVAVGVHRSGEAEVCAGHVLRPHCTTLN